MHALVHYYRRAMDDYHEKGLQDDICFVNYDDSENAIHGGDGDAIVDGASIFCCIVGGLYLNPFIAAGQMMMMIIICQMIMMMKTMSMTTMMMMMMIVCMFCCITWPLHARARFNCCGMHIDCTSMRKVIVMMIRGRRRMTTAMMMTTATMMGILTCQKSGII